ncbi:MAG: peptide chain release factor N(5)-glutamine methyltransferase, partial [Peptococcaceae bacterium]|nr:peptide chain release factor N(5)-glutamine methyltransferase [Peptococcaceae bacterium]
LIPEAAVLLKPGGYLLMEIGSRQREGIFAMLNTSSWTVNIIQDLAGLDRLVIAKLCRQNT